jgi:hypothetical protein
MHQEYARGWDRPRACWVERKGVRKFRVPLIQLGPKLGKGGTFRRLRWGANGIYPGYYVAGNDACDVCDEH